MKVSQLNDWLVTVKDSDGKVLKSIPAPSKYAAKQLRKRLSETSDTGHTVEANLRHAA